MASAPLGAAPDPSALDPARAAEQARRLRSNVERAVRGKSELIRQTVEAWVAGGHLLLEDVPGVGKTTLAHALARSVDASFKRIQFTSDLLPCDLVGSAVPELVEGPPSGRFVFQPGPLFAQVVLADEINRASPKTQSALLEAMAEGSVSVDGTVHRLPQPFLVVATQNPLEHHGVHPLPESQLDRFLMRLRIGYPEPADEAAVLRDDPAATASGPPPRGPPRHPNPHADSAFRSGSAEESGHARVPAGTWLRPRFQQRLRDVRCWF
ncbi:MAG TPA: AAA family ATPase [Acidimicrobiales bacterium]|nr:AAA family ATPase [Acidimicrobiales bacterium]